MQRDLLLVRELMLYLETKEAGPIHGNAIKIDGYSAQEVNYHIKLLHQAGFVEVIDVSTKGPEFFVQDITWDGHTFLDLLKKDTTGNKIKEFAKAAGGWTVETVFKVLIELYAKQYGLIT